jgi:hypothetical protein
MGAWWDAGGVCQQRDHALLFSGALKTYTNPGGGQTPQMKECGEGQDGSQLGVGGLSHAHATYMSPKLF